MKKRVTKVLLGKKGKRKSGMIGQLKSLFTYGKIKVANSTAKQLTRLVDRLIVRTKGKDKLSAIRYLITNISDIALAKEILNYSAKAMLKRQSGFCTLTKLGPRRGDAHEQTVIELLDFVKKETVKKALPKSKKSAVIAEKAPVKK